MPRQRPDLQEWLVGTFLGCEPRCFQQGSFLKLWADCPLWPLQTPATTGQSRRCSLDRPWAGYTQVTALWPMGSESCSCSQGPNWLMVQFHAYYFKAVFCSASLAGLPETSGNNDQNASFFKKAHNRFIYGLTRKGSFSRANMFQRKVYFH